MVRDEEKRMIGKRIRIIELAGENDLVNSKYSGREGIIASIDDMGQYHVIWDGTDRISGLAINPQEDDYEIINFLEEDLRLRRNRFGRNRLNESFVDKTLSTEIRKHGGLDNNYYSKTRDARTQTTWYEISKNAKYTSYIPEEDLNKILYQYHLNPYFNFYEQVLLCNDGGAIVIKHDIKTNHDENDMCGNLKAIKRNKYFGDTYMKDTKNLNVDKYSLWKASDTNDQQIMRRTKHISDNEQSRIKK